MNADDNDQQSDPILETRRKFLKIAIATLTFTIGVVLGLPFIRTLYLSATVKKEGWSEVAKLEALPLSKPVNIKFPAQSEDAFVRGVVVRSVWVIKHSGTELSVFSPVCTHLGCYFTWNQISERFECPCHASVFSMDGKVLSGPAPRPLDILPHKVENNTLFVRWEEFKAGVTKKIRI